MEDKRYAPVALDFIRQIERPVCGCPGNWDCGSAADFEEYQKAFRAIGCAWLEDRCLVLPGKNLELIGMGLRGVHKLEEAKAPRRVLLIQYPIQADRLEGRRYDLILAGHPPAARCASHSTARPFFPTASNVTRRGSTSR